MVEKQQNHAASAFLAHARPTQNATYLGVVHDQYCGSKQTLCGKQCRQKNPSAMVCAQCTEAFDPLLHFLSPILLPGRIQGSRQSTPQASSGT